MKKKLAIVGAGDLGKQIAHFAITDNHYSNVVFFDDFYKDTHFNNFKVLGKINDIEECFTKNFFDEIIIGIGYNHLDFKEKLFKKIKNNNIPFGKIVHSSSIVDSSAKIGEGTLIYPGVIIDANVKIEDNVLINIGCVICHDNVISSHCFLSPRVTLAGFVSIAKKCILGTNCTVIDNINLSKSIQIGAGCVVTKNINKSGLYVGIPARFIR